MAGDSLDGRWAQMIAAQASVAAELNGVKGSLDLIRGDLKQLHNRIDRANERIKSTDDKHDQLAQSQRRELDSRIASLEKRATGEDAVRKSDQRRQNVRLVLGSVLLTSFLTWLATHFWPFTK